jgi:transcriptional regulator with XRE-family HTH domain
MQRVVLTKKDREKFFNDLLKKTVNLNIIAPQYGISGRTLRDWRRGKFLPTLDILEKIAKDFNIKLPPFKTRPQYWYAVKGAKRGALKRMELYGPPGTTEGRRKGGLVSQQKRRENPEYYKKRGCILAKNFKNLKKSEKLAELFGILLGDGCITYNQVKITLHKIDDKRYGEFVENLMLQEFREKPSRYERKSVFDYMLSGVNLVKRIEDFGLKKGNKIKQKVDIPNWILEKRKFSISCVRGLIDTDGGVYVHRHVVRRKRYYHFGLCFTSASRPLLKSVHKILIELGINAKIQGETRIYIYGLKETLKYFKIVGFNNPKHRDKLTTYLKLKR